MAALGTSYDMIWTTGQGSSASPGTSTYANLHTVTGKTILVDESFGLSAQGDTWANQTATTINARIAGGVVAANITNRYSVVSTDQLDQHASAVRTEFNLPLIPQHSPSPLPWRTWAGDPHLPWQRPPVSGSVVQWFSGSVVQFQRLAEILMTVERRWPQALAWGLATPRG